ncbi:BON domain-containing protein [Microvirga terrestris]|uniref:BON domain-containing protein n=1 Tax=Microvirga terrestris TaxID=2791024 RepID=A0ABS0HV84_9HYPH|nr:BON domain-containing protein [Microvirga terrestris]MBF9197384.1 BON domain-containing protein [Microvirga terrestris]
MDDLVLQQLVIDELEFEPSVDAANIGVAVDSGVVTLTGHVGSYAEKIAAERAAQRVRGVRAIAQEIQVRYPSDKKTSDDEIAKRAADILAWDARVPDEGIQIKVQNGWVMLTGTVEWQYQRVAAESGVRKLSGVIGVSNEIELKPQVKAPDVRDKILSALKRNAEIEADSIRVSVNGDEVTLEGRVHDWYERIVIERAAWSAPGVKHVHDRMTLS